MLAWIYEEKFHSKKTTEQYILDHRKTMIQMSFNYFSQGGKKGDENLGQQILFNLECLNERFKTHFVLKAEDPLMSYEKLALTAPDPLPTIFFTGKTKLDTGHAT